MRCEAAARARLWRAYVAGGMRVRHGDCNAQGVAKACEAANIRRTLGTLLQGNEAFESQRGTIAVACGLLVMISPYDEGKPWLTSLARCSDASPEVLANTLPRHATTTPVHAKQRMPATRCTNGFFTSITVSHGVPVFVAILYTALQMWHCSSLLQTLDGLARFQLY